MTTDRTMLENAARACGIENVTPSMVEWGQWNPKDSDGDCARMESSCNINIVWFTSGVTSIVDDIAVCEPFADHNGDKDAARRLASTRAAEAIGKGMKA